MRLGLVALMGAAMVAGQAFALGTIRVTSDVPAYVELKDEKLGDAPLALHDLRKGTYELVITAFATGETKTYKVSIPPHSSVIRRVRARFGDTDGRQAGRARTPAEAARHSAALEEAALRAMPSSLTSPTSPAMGAVMARRRRASWLGRKRSVNSSTLPLVSFSWSAASFA